MKKILLLVTIVLGISSASAFALDVPAFSDVPTDSVHASSNWNNYSGYLVNPTDQSSKQLWTGKWYNNTLNTRSYLQFTLPTLSIASASLMLYSFENDAAQGNSSVSVYATSTGWNEATMTWNDQPVLIGSALATTTVGKTFGWYSWDISEYASSLVPGATLSLALTSTGPGHSYYARESSTGFGPKLSITTTPEPVSMVLFGLGAGVLGLAQFRRNKKK
ncbi:MAG: DNRLRE domain-containing protein [Candidatus Omnitrophota bacterium]